MVYPLAHRNMSGLYQRFVTAQGILRGDGANICILLARGGCPLASQIAVLLFPLRMSQGWFTVHVTVMGSPKAYSTATKLTEGTSKALSWGLAEGKNSSTLRSSTAHSFIGDFVCRRILWKLGHKVERRVRKAFDIFFFLSTCSFSLLQIAKCQNGFIKAKVCGMAPTAKAPLSLSSL